MAEWFKASVLKTEGWYYLAGSNPVPLLAAVAQLGRASVLHVGGYGFESRRLHYFKNYKILQYVTEWLTCPLWEREIEGSSPSVLIFKFGCALSLMDRVVAF